MGDEGDVCEIIDASGNILYSYKTEPLSHTYCYNGFFYYINDSNDNYYHGLYNYKGEQVFKSDFIYSMNNECIITKEKSNYVFLFFDSKGINKKNYYCQTHIPMSLFQMDLQGFLFLIMIKKFLV